jgi:hypothetical protein
MFASKLNYFLGLQTWNTLSWATQKLPIGGVPRDDSHFLQPHMHHVTILLERVPFRLIYLFIYTLIYLYLKLYFQRNDQTILPSLNSQPCSSCMFFFFFFFETLIFYKPQKGLKIKPHILRTPHKWRPLDLFGPPTRQSRTLKVQVWERLSPEVGGSATFGDLKSHTPSSPPPPPTPQLTILTVETTCLPPSCFRSSDRSNGFSKGQIRLTNCHEHDLNRTPWIKGYNIPSPPPPTSFFLVKWSIGWKKCTVWLFRN